MPSHSRRPVAPLRVALLGLGTVGREVARGLVERADELAAVSGGRRLVLTAIGVRDPERARGQALPPTVRRTADLAGLALAPDVDVLVELIGGQAPAGRLVAAALDAGKAVVTANKALLSRHGAALERRARASGSPLRFEAAVGAGIPILGALAGDLAANEWLSLGGILNGATNYVLTAMAQQGRAYEDVVAEAREHGYLEADHDADTEGRDAADKLAILIRLAFGGWPDVTAIRRAPPARGGDGAPGITGVSAELIERAARDGLAIKLAAWARRRPGGRLSASVLPCAIPLDQPLARTDWATNRIELTGSPVGHLAFSGPGAGGPATSSAVLGDLIALARGAGSTWAGLPAAGRLPADGLDDGLDGIVRWLPLGGTRFPIVSTI